MKILIYVLTILSTLTANIALAAGNASTFDTEAWEQKVNAFTKMTGKTYEYEVSGYRIKLQFEDENNILWERLKAPDGTTGLTGKQKVDRMNVHPGIFIMAWTEPDGSHVVDIVDTQRMMIYANFVMPDGQRFQTKASLEASR